jgi:hypothetical protein
MRAIHLVGPDVTAGVRPLCGTWGSMDTDWTTVSSEVTCTACTTNIRLLASAAGRRAP